MDFKTTTNRPAVEIHQDQLRLYATAMARCGYEPVRLAIHDLEKGARIEVPAEPGAQAAFEDRLEEWINGIRSGVFTPNTTACRTCDFSGLWPPRRSRLGCCIGGVRT